MAKEINYKLTIDTKNSLKSIEELEQELEQMNDELRTLATGSDAFKELKEKVVDADSKMKNLTKSIEGMDFDQVAGEAGKFAGGIGAITASFMLLGDAENKTMKELQENLNKSLGLIMAVKGAVEVWTSATKLLVPVQKALNTAMAANPIGLMVAGVVALSAAIGGLIYFYGDWEDEIDDVTKAHNDLNDNMEEISKELGKEISQMKLLTTTLRDASSSTNDRKKAIKELQKMYPGYLKDLNAEKLTLDDIKKLENELIALSYNKIIEKRKIQAIERETLDETNQIIKASMKMSEAYDKLSSKELENYQKILTAYKDGDISRQDYFNKTNNLLGKNASYIINAFTDIQKYQNQITAETEKQNDIYDRLKRNVGLVEDEVEDLGKTATKTGKKFKEAFDEEDFGLGISEDFWDEVTTNANKSADDIKEYEADTYQERLETDKSYYEDRIVLGTASNEEEMFLEITNLKLSSEYAQASEEEKQKAIQLIKDKYKVDEPTFLEQLFGTDDPSKMVQKMGDVMTEIMSRVNDIYKNNLEQQLEDNQTLLEEGLEKELKMYEGNEEQQAIVKEKYEKKKAKMEEEFKRKAAERDKQLATFEVMISTAAAIMKTWEGYADFGPPGFVAAGIQTAFITALAGVQIAAIQSQKFAKGGLLNGPSHEQGGILTNFGELEGGEAVINKRATTQFAPVLSAINQSTGGNPIGGSSSSIIDYDLLASKINNKKVYVVSSEMTSQQGTDTKIIDRATF